MIGEDPDTWACRFVIQSGAANWIGMNKDIETQGGVIGDGDSRTLPAPPLPNQEHPVVLAGTGAVISIEIRCWWQLDFWVP
jgi:hypothetical protein